MSLAHIAGLIENDRRTAVMSATWGHLAPEIRRVYTGYIECALDAFGQVAILRYQFEGLEDSPWFYEDMTDRVYEWLHTRQTGSVYRWEGTFMRFKNGGSRFSGRITRARR